MGSQFFIVMYMSITCLTVIPIWMEDFKVLFRESHSLIYTLKAYFLSTLIIDIVVMRLIPTSFFIIPYFMIGLGGGSTSRGMIFLAILFLINVSFSGLCMAVGAMAKTAAVANFIGSFIIQFLLLSSGFLVNQTALPSELVWIVDLLPGKNGYESLLINEFGGSGRQYYFTSHADKILDILHSSLMSSMIDK